MDSWFVGLLGVGVAGLIALGGDLTLEIGEVGRERAVCAEGFSGAGAGGEEGLARERSVFAVEAEHRARLALGGGYGAPEQGGERAEHLRQAEARLADTEFADRVAAVDGVVNLAACRIAR